MRVAGSEKGLLGWVMIGGEEAAGESVKEIAKKKHKRGGVSGLTHTSNASTFVCISGSGVCALASVPLLQLRGILLS